MSAGDAAIGDHTQDGHIQGGPRIGRVLQDSTLYLLGNIASRAVGFLAIPFYSRFLSTTQYGVLELIELSTQVVAISFGLQSIGMALTRLFHEQTTLAGERQVVSTALIASTVISAVVMLVMVAASGLLSRAVFHSAGMTSLLQAAFVAMFFANMAEVALVYERIRGRAKFFLVYSMVTLAATLALNIYFIGVAGYGVWGFVCSKLVVTTAAAIYLLWRVGADAGWAWQQRYIPEFIRFGAPLILSSVSFFAIHFSDRFFLSASVGLADLGRYALAYRFAFLVSILVGDSFTKSWSVSFYRYAGRDGWQRQFAHVAAYLMFVLCLTALAISILGPELLAVMVPPSFYPPFLLLPMLVVSYVFRELGDFFRDLLLINKRSVRVGQIAFGGAVLNSGCNLLLIPAYGLYGAGLATMVTWMAYSGVCWAIANREHHVPVRGAAFAGILALMGLVYAAAAALRLPNHWLQVALDLAWVGLFAVLCLGFYFSGAERRQIRAAAARVLSHLWRLGDRARPPGATMNDTQILTPMPPMTGRWRDSPGRRLAIAVAYPVFRLLNRPSLAWFAHGLYDFALRCNGIAINFHGRHGLTVGEERFAAAWLRPGASGAQLTPGTPGVLLDVGANHGAYTLYLRRLVPTARIYAFEPHPKTFTILQGRLGADADVTLLPLAVSDSPGAMRLYDFADDDGSTQASLDEGAVRLFTGAVRSHDVTVTTIDAVMAEFAIERIRLLKIDTEGFDLAVLRGAKQALAARTIDAIQFEFIPANIARHVTMRDFFEVLQGYRIFRLCMNGGLTPLDPYDVKRCEIYVTHNLIALPRQ